MKSIENEILRLSAIPDRKTADLFASSEQAEDLTLLGELIDGSAFPMRVAKATAEIERVEPEQGSLF